MTDKVTNIKELKAGGFDIPEIAVMLHMKPDEVRGALTELNKPSESDAGNLDDLKNDIIVTAKSAVTQIKQDIGHTDAADTAKLTDSLTKLYTAFFKEDKGTQITIQQNNLSMFKHSLKG